MKVLIDGHGEIDVQYSHDFSIYGYWQINAIVEYNGAKEEFYHTVMNDEWIDELNELKQEASHEDVQSFYHEFTIEKIKEEILEWLPISI